MKFWMSIYFLLLLVSCSNHEKANKFTIASPDKPVTFYMDPNADSLIVWAVTDLVDDIMEMTGQKVYVQFSAERPEGKVIIVGQATDRLMMNYSPSVKAIRGKWEAFHIESQAGQLLIAGSDIRGTVYGVFDVAEKLGISPWKWWADVHPLKQEILSLELPPNGIIEEPSVKFRGIFLNDEDWGLHPWAAKTFEPETGDIGPKTYEKIFQLLLRLKANTIWPAMHPCTTAYYKIPGNNEMARKYHIVVGTSHCEPMLRNNVDEWDHKKYGDYNFFDNREMVCNYWQDRVNNVNGADNIFTLGMRGIHDGRMQGNASPQEKMEMLEKVIETQREMLSASRQKPVEEIPQVMVLYKEVLDQYNQGMQIPDDVTLMWCDDNYGYIRRLSNEEEQQRSGSSGVYYHLSYWGRPHDYLWLSSTQQGQIWEEMEKAYANGANRIWIANVGDIKPAEYNIEFFLDLAWNCEKYTHKNLHQHMEQWAKREFGSSIGKETASIMKEYYRLAALRKPEFMGWSQTERTTPVYPTAFSKEGQQCRLDHYDALVKKVEKLKVNLPKARKEAWFQLVDYPIKGVANMNRKFIYYQMAMESNDSLQGKEYMSLAHHAYDEIDSLTRFYNESISDGKWNRIMSFHPRNLPVYKFPDWKPKSDGNKTMNEEPVRVYIQANAYTKCSGTNAYAWHAVDGLGYSNAAITLLPLKTTSFADNQQPWIEYEFDAPQAGDYELQVRCLPTHSNNYNHQLAVQVDNDPAVTFDLNTKGRSSEWKVNILRNAQVVVYKGQIKNKGKHRIKLAVNQTGIVIDQLAVDFTPELPFYEIPYAD